MKTAAVTCLRKKKMIELAKTAAKQIYRFLTHRLLWLFVLTAVLFTLLFARLFALQIVEADRWVAVPPANVFIEMPLQPLRGTIYDRHGRPLAENTLVFVAKMDPSVAISNEALLELTQLFEENEERFVDNFPIAISPGGDFAFTFTGNDTARAHREYRWKHDMAIPSHADATAYESFMHLRRHFRIDPELCDQDARRILNFRCQIFMFRLIDFRHYNPVPIVFATGVSHATMAAISERSEFFSGLFIDIQTQRVYPGGRYVSHIIGYVQRITERQYLANRHLGYTQQCLFGRSGLEFELEVAHMRGTPGIQRIEVNRAGRRVGVPEVILEPVSGDRVFLSIDLELQRAAYYMLKDYLTQALINRLTIGPQDNEPVPHQLSMPDAFISLVRHGGLDIHAVMDAEPGNAAYAMKLYILERQRDPWEYGLARIIEIITYGLQREWISPAKMLLTLIGTEQIDDPEGLTAARLLSRPQDALQILIEKLRTRELTPQQFNVDPSTGSIVILDVHTGGILAAVSYPAFDNSRFVNVMDNAYVSRHYSDPTRPSIYRAFMEARAPGSTFKMIPAIAALEMGTIGANTIITSHGRFQIGEEPNPLLCWARRGHGRMNVKEALAVSCNVFFAESIFRIGNDISHATRDAVDAIEIFNAYMAYFGLHEHTGAELWEHYHAIRARGYTGSLMPSPEWNRHLLRDNYARWFDTYTAQISIGQGITAFTPAQMARVMLGLANRNAPYPLHFVRLVENREGQVLVDRRHAPDMPEPALDIADSTWDTVIEGMRLATEGSSGGHRGTAVGVFEHFPIQIAGKTGTAEEVGDRFAHTAFGAFAPLRNPQIALYVNLPFSHASRASHQFPAHIARDMIGIALGLGHTPEYPRPLNTVRP